MDDGSTEEPMDFLQTLASASILAPPTGVAELSEVESFGRWSWGTRQLDEEGLYMFAAESVARELLDNGPLFALCHAGHGMNSYGLNLVTARGPIGAFVQHGWGGVYTDALQAVFRVNQTYARLHQLFDRIADPKADLRWLLLYSEFRGVCGVLDLEQYAATESFDNAFTNLGSDNRGRPDEVPLFELFLAIPGVLNEAFNREPEWSFPPVTASAGGVETHPNDAHSGTASGSAVLDERDPPPVTELSQPVRQRGNLIALGGKAAVRPEAVGSETERQAWLYASRYLRSWPDLIMSWMDWHDGPAHFVLHKDPFSAAIHFDSDEHPFWVGPTGEEKEILWDDVHEMGGHASADVFDLRAAWGPSELSLVDSSRSKAYELIAALTARDVDGEFPRVRPAKLLANEGDSSAHDLREEFATLDSTLTWYTDLISVEYRRRQRAGETAYWHEPLWLVCWGDTPLIVIDEAGRAHIRGAEFDIAELIAEADGPSGAVNLLLQRARAAVSTGAAEASVGTVFDRVAALVAEVENEASKSRTTRNAHLDEHGRLVSADRITAIDLDEVFVFGANGQGRHGSGSARAAYDRFGAGWGVADGLTGQSYAIDTMSGESVMAAAIERFLGYAADHPASVFLVTAIGTGIAGYTHAQVAQYFAGAGTNVALPQEFWDALPTPLLTGAASTPTEKKIRALAPLVGRKAQGRQAPSKVPSQWLDRAVGAMVGMAIGDALGSQYEFGPPHPDDFAPEFGVGAFGHGIGEWTDDTSMALPILEAVARGESLRDEAVLGWIVGEWDEWAKTAKDVGTQTRQVLDRLDGIHTEQAARAAAKANHESTGRSAGNGSLMRTAPVALAYLEDGRERRLVEAAARVAQLTHWESSNIEACALWCLFVRQAIRTGDFDAWEQRLFIVDPDRDLDGSTLIDLDLHGHPRDYREKNGWVVKAFQSAHVAIRGASDFRQAIHRAIQGGGDTDTVAAITGALAGAKWGVSGIPLTWQRKVHGWPGYDVNDLARLAILAVRRGESDRQGWPAGDSVLNPQFRHTAPVRHPYDAGVWLGSQSALTMLPDPVDAVVSLGRLGAKEVPAGVESIRVWLIDKPDQNLSLDITLADAVDVIAELRAEGKEVFVHCAEARSRTSAVAALYAARHLGVPLDEAWSALSTTLPYYAPAPFLQEAVARIIAGTPVS